jgi:cyclomaltodextrinase
VLVASPRATVETWQAGGRFGAIVPLLEGDNEVRAICRRGKADHSVSEPQHWTVRLRDAPKAWIRIVPAEDGIVLDAGASEPAPARSTPIVAHQWRSISGNPQPLTTANGVTVGETPIASDELNLRTPGVEGEYQITLRVTDALGGTDESTAAFLVENGKQRAAELAEERPAWLDGAVVYGVVPFFFGPRGFDDVTTWLDAIKQLGASVLWLSPITGTEEGDFGYAVTDHFGLRDAFGTEQDVRELIAAAETRGLRVIMDFVPNHTSEQHPYYLNTATSMGRLTLNVLLSFAQFEREVTAERIRDKIAASKKKGLWMGGLVPLGYDAKDRTLVVNEAEAQTVRTIFQLYLELGCARRVKEAADRQGCSANIAGSTR